MWACSRVAADPEKIAHGWNKALAGNLDSDAVVIYRTADIRPRYFNLFATGSDIGSLTRGDTIACRLQRL